MIQKALSSFKDWTKSVTLSIGFLVTVFTIWTTTVFYVGQKINSQPEQDLTTIVQELKEHDKAIVDSKITDARITTVLERVTENQQEDRLDINRINNNVRDLEKKVYSHTVQK